MKVWVLTEHHNMYDQLGGYFAGVFLTEEDARGAVDHIGRRDVEDMWYALDEVEVGELSELKDDYGQNLAF